MTKTFSLLLLILFFYSCKPQAQQPQLSVQQVQSDFDSLRSALQEAHSGLYRYSSKTQMDSIFNHYRSQLDHPMTTLQFISVIAELLQTARDGHLRLEPDSITAAQLSKAKLFPLKLMVEGSKLFILFNETADDQNVRPGMELLSINNHNAAGLVSLFLSKISDDGFIETGKKKRMERNFAALYYLYVDSDSVFNVHLKDLAGKTISASLRGVVTTDRENNRLNNTINNTIKKSIASFPDSPANVSVRYINNSIAALRIKSFTDDGYYTDIDNAFQSIKDHHTRSLILDLRGNGGGSDNYGAYLVAQFMDHLFRYFDHIRMKTINPSFTKLRQASIENFRNGTVPDPNGGYLLTTAIHTGLGEQAPGKNPFLGKIIVLMDGNTFSTAADVTALLRHLTRTVFVGEESGGCYEGNTSGSSARFIFPGSKLMLNINMWDYYNAVKPAANKGRGTMPDFTVPVTVSDLLKGIDAPWEKALEIAIANN